MRRFMHVAAIGIFIFTVAIPAVAGQRRDQRPQGDSATRQSRRQGGMPHKRAQGRGDRGQQRFRQLDKDNNGAISLSEWPRTSRVFQRFDRNHDGQLTASELKRTHDRRARRAR